MKRTRLVFDVVVAFVVCCVVARQAAANPSINEVFEEDQLWKGSYACGGSRTDVQLRIEGIFANEVRALFAFDFRGTKGSYYVSGQYEPALRQLRLVPGRWVKRPAERRSVPISGVVSEDGLVYTGRIDLQGCYDFTVYREGPALVVAPPPNIAPVAEVGTAGTVTEPGGPTAEGSQTAKGVGETAEQTAVKTIQPLGGGGDFVILDPVIKAGEPRREGGQRDVWVVGTLVNNGERDFRKVTVKVFLKVGKRNFHVAAELRNVSAGGKMSFTTKPKRTKGEVVFSDKQIVVRAIIAK